MTRVLIVDPEKREIREEDLEFGSALEGVREVIGGWAEMVPLAKVLMRHAMFVDEEAGLKRDSHTRARWCLPELGSVRWIGPGVIFGTNGSHSVDATVSVRHLEEMVRWETASSEQASVA